jgi:hypothetical protein
MHEKSLSVDRGYGDFIMVLYNQSRLEYAKSIIACTENTLKEYKRILRIRQDYIAVYGDYANLRKS